MNNQNFYLRLVALLLIIMSVFFYNGTVKDKEQEQNIADLTAKVESLEEQQDQILTAIQETYEEQKAAAESKAASDTSDADSRENLTTAKKMLTRQILKQKEQRNQKKLLLTIPTISIKMEHTKAQEPDMAEPSPYR